MNIPQHNSRRSTFSMRTLAAAACFSVALVACGGGGGGGGGDNNTPAPISFPVSTAVVAYAQSAHQFNLAGAVGATTVTLAYTYTPGPNASFSGLPASTATETVTLRANGVVADQTTLVSYFALNPYTSYGSIDQATGEYSVFTQTASLPASATIGQAGALGSDATYASAALGPVLESSTLSWSLEADTPATALFCLNVTVTSGGAGSGAQCYRIDSSGTVLGLVIRVTVGGQTVTLL